MSAIQDIDPHLQDVDDDVLLSLTEENPFHTETIAAPVELRPTPWLIDAADLLAEPDPGATPWLVDDLIVDAAIVAVVGRWKTTKSYGLLDLCISIATGEPAFGRYAIPTPGPVVFVNEESGRAAMWRRLDALRRGRGIDRERLRDRLFVSPNARVKLDDPAWQTQLIDLGTMIRPRLFVFDPLARMKAAGRDENAQTDMGVLIDFLRELRDTTGAAVCFVHHTGHAGGDRMRGSSDLESAWESRLVWKRDGQSPLVTIETEHREAEGSEPLQYRIAWDGDLRTIRFNAVNDQDGLPPLSQRIIEWLREHPHQKADEIAKGIETRASDVRRTLADLEQAGTTHNGPSGRRDAAGRAIRDKVWNLANSLPQTLDLPRPDTRPTQDDPPAEHRGSSQRPTYIGGRGTAEPPDTPPAPDDNIDFTAYAGELHTNATTETNQ